MISCSGSPEKTFIKVLKHSYHIYIHCLQVATAHMTQCQVLRLFGLDGCKLLVTEEIFWIKLSK